MKKRKKGFFSKTKPDVKSNPSGDYRVDEFLTSKRHEKWNGKDYDNESIIKDATGELLSYKFNQAFSMIFANITQLLIKNELIIINSYMHDINELANKCSKFNKV